MDSATGSLTDHGEAKRSRWLTEVPLSPMQSGDGIDNLPLGPTRQTRLRLRHHRTAIALPASGPSLYFFHRPRWILRRLVVALFRRTNSGRPSWVIADFLA
jgi:hypothetical protein